MIQTFGGFLAWKRVPIILNDRNACFTAALIVLNVCLPLLHRYKKMEACVTAYPETTKADEFAGGTWKPFPERLNAVPFRISSGSIPGVSIETYQQDNQSWKRHVNAYKRVNKLIDSGRYRNILDMNAGLGNFAAALESPKLWVMNVMPTIAETDTLGVIYERGLIGIYHDW